MQVGPHAGPVSQWRQGPPAQHSPAKLKLGGAYQRTRALTFIRRMLPHVPHHPVGHGRRRQCGARRYGRACFSPGGFHDWLLTHTGFPDREGQVLGDNVPAEDFRLSGQCDLAERAGRFPHHRPCCTHHPVSHRGAGKHADRHQTGRPGQLPHAALSEPCLVGEIPVRMWPPNGLSDLDLRATNTLGRQCRRDPVKGFQYFIFGEVLGTSVAVTAANSSRRDPSMSR